MFKGSENVGHGEHSYAHLQQRRHDERHDQRGPDAVLRDPARQPARARRCSSKAIACARWSSTRRTSTTSATPSRKNAGSRVDNQPYGATFERIDRAGLRQPRLQALGDRIDGRPQRRVGRRRGGVLQDLLRAEQRHPVDRRRRRHQEDDGARRASTSARSHRSRPPHAAESRRAAAHGRAAQHDRGSAGAPRRASTSPGLGPPADSPDHDALDVLSDVLSGGRSARLQSGPSCARSSSPTGASALSLGREQGPEPLPDCRHRGARQEPSRRRGRASTRRSRR